MVCVGTMGFSLLRRTKATTAKTSTTTPSETVMDTKFMPMGDNPKKSPMSPVKLKLNATERVISSMTSKRFLPRNRMLIKQ